MMKQEQRDNTSKISQFNKREEKTVKLKELQKEIEIKEKEKKNSIKKNDVQIKRVTEAKLKRDENNAIKDTIRTEL